MPKKLTAYERALRDLPKQSNADIDATDAMQAKDSESTLWELAWAVLRWLRDHPQALAEYPSQASEDKARSILSRMAAGV